MATDSAAAEPGGQDEAFNAEFGDDDDEEDDEDMLDEEDDASQS